MRRKKLIICAVAMSMMLGLLTACGNGVNGDNQTGITQENDNADELSSDEESAVNEEGIGAENSETENADVQNADAEGASTEAADNNDEAAALDFRSITKEQCASELDSLRLNEPAEPAVTELLSEMAKCATFSRVIDEQGCIFKDMDSYRKGALRGQMYKDIMWEGTAFFSAITVSDAGGKYDADKIIPVDEAKRFFDEVYGEEDFTADEHIEIIEDGYVMLSFGDGDPWEYIEHMQIFEDDHFYLLTGPAFYEDNGGSQSYMGYADILFAKNPDSRYGVTMIYGRYRKETVKVSNTEASSNLSAANGKTYDAANLIDGNYETAWVEGVAGVGIGETITLHLGEVSDVYGIQLYNGYLASGDLFEKNGKVTEVSVDFGGGMVVEKELYGIYYGWGSAENLASFNLNKIELDKPVATDTIVITIKNAEAGNKYDDTCISEITVY
ncbi:MAG: hypothetical protein IJ661_08705 [Lachnospiraceae bacterium]|nr:hypothetical protein [Lachnospiraceae bacterium]